MKSYRKTFLFFILSFIFYIIYKYSYYESLIKDTNIYLKFEKNIL